MPVLEPVSPISQELGVKFKLGVTSQLFFDPESEEEDKRECGVLLAEPVSSLTDLLEQLPDLDPD